MKKIARMKIIFPTYKTYHFSFLWTFLLLNLITSYFLFILNDLKCYRVAIEVLQINELL
jgi:hypothetical protein